MTPDLMIPQFVHIDEQARLTTVFGEVYEAIAGPRPQFLFHYTTAAGAIGILQSGQIFATNAFYTNDRGEIQLSLLMFGAAVAERLSRQPLSKSLKVALELMLKRVDEGLKRPAPIYVASFSTQVDDNAQWGMYGGREGGFNLAFQWQMLAELSFRRGAWLVPCLYDQEAQKALIVKAVAEFAPLLEQTLDRHKETAPETIVEEVVEYFLWRLSAFAPILKGPAFQHEREWRLVVFQFSSNQLEFEARNNIIRPRVRFELKDLNSGATIPSLMGVTVGPSPHQRLSTEAIKALLLSLGYSKDTKGFPRLPVIESNSTLRIV